MLAQGDWQFQVLSGCELVPHDLWAVKARLIIACSPYPADFDIQSATSLNNASAHWSYQKCCFYF
uniref:Uncharacterized protein n=1 Tax=Oryctolagus cuniculus TaxID=9986 RepID=A0A5F9DU72_RABIT